MSILLTTVSPVPFIGQLNIDCLNKASQRCFMLISTTARYFTHFSEGALILERLSNLLSHTGIKVEGL